VRSLRHGSTGPLRAGDRIAGTGVHTHAAAWWGDAVQRLAAGRTGRLLGAIAANG